MPARRSSGKVEVRWIRPSKREGTDCMSDQGIKRHLMSGISSEMRAAEREAAREITRFKQMRVLKWAGVVAAIVVASVAGLFW